MRGERDQVYGYYSEVIISCYLAEEAYRIVHNQN